MKKQKSPCIDKCEFSGPKNWCLGCARTRQESQKWKNMKPFDKTKIEKELPKRMNIIVTQQAGN